MERKEKCQKEKEKKNILGNSSSDTAEQKNRKLLGDKNLRLASTTF